MKLIQNSNFRVQGVFFQQLRKITTRHALENKCCNRLCDYQCKSSSEEVDISLEEREEKTADISDIFEFQLLLSMQEN